MDLWILMVLILASGVLSMAEMAVGASRTAHLRMMADEGQEGARTVLQFRESPSRLLATTQLGITALAMLSGIFGEALWVPRLEAGIVLHLPAAAPFAYGLSLALVVTVVTFFSLVFGEVVPKRLALARPEAVAVAMSGLMDWMLRLAGPLIWGVSRTSDAVLRFFPAKGSAEASASDEIRILIESGRKDGRLDETESEILGNVFRLDNRRVGAIMTPAANIAYLDLTLPREANMAVLQARSVSRFLVCKGGVVNPLGFVESRDLLRAVLAGKSLDFGALSPVTPHYVPNALSLIGLLEFFKANRTQIALVVNEFGATEGLVTLSDLMGTVVGDVLSGAVESPLALPREDGSWLLDGLLPTDELKELLELPELPGEELGNYHTLGGFVVSQLGKVPKKTEAFIWGGWRFEVMDMEKNRVDEVLAKRVEG
ncbi:MAG: hemolysin family protein [Azovibrio sp.]|uniref:hemolysin family protein n=1 Tax=Azovibrio sp. TaxID=1872673 RepID=UPI003C78F4F9